MSIRSRRRSRRRLPRWIALAVVLLAVLLMEAALARALVRAYLLAAHGVRVRGTVIESSLNYQPNTQSFSLPHPAVTYRYTYARRNYEGIAQVPESAVPQLKPGRAVDLVVLSRWPAVSVLANSVSLPSALLSLGAFAALHVVAGAVWLRRRRASRPPDRRRGRGR